VTCECANCSARITRAQAGGCRLPWSSRKSTCRTGQPRRLREQLVRLKSLASVLRPRGNRAWTSSRCNAVRTRRRGRQVPPAKIGGARQKVAPQTGIVSIRSLVLDRPIDWTAFGIWVEPLRRAGRANDCFAGEVESFASRAATPGVHQRRAATSSIPPRHMSAGPTPDETARASCFTRAHRSRKLRRLVEAFCRLVAGGFRAVVVLDCGLSSRLEARTSRTEGPWTCRNCCSPRAQARHAGRTG